MSILRGLLKDDKCCIRFGTVFVPDGEKQHYEILPGLEDILVDVEIHPTGQDLTCRLSGGPAWRIPSAGEEVIVALPDGEIDFMPVILASLSDGELPDGLEPNVIVLAESQVLIHDGKGGAEPLPTMAEFLGHTHNGGMGPTTPTTDPIPGVGLIKGTEILKAK